MKPIWVNYTGQRTTESGVDGFVWKTHYFHQLVISNFQPRPDSIFCSLRMVLWCPISKNVSHDICHHNTSYPSYPQMFSDISYTRSIVVKLPIDPITIPSVPFRCPGQCFAWRCWLPDVNGALRNAKCPNPHTASCWWNVQPCGIREAIFNVEPCWTHSI